MYNLAIQPFSPAFPETGQFFSGQLAPASPRPPRQAGAFRVIVLIRVKYFVRIQAASGTGIVHGTIQIRGEGFQS